MHSQDCWPGVVAIGPHIQIQGSKGKIRSDFKFSSSSAEAEYMQVTGTTTRGTKANSLPVQSGVPCIDVDASPTSGQWLNCFGQCQI
jgi:hypothetical protein